MPSRATQPRSSDPIPVFEEKFAKYVGVKYAVAVSSGTTGLMAVMMALQLEPGDNIVTTPLTFVAISNSVLSAGGIPLYADIDKSTLCLDPEQARIAMNNRTKAVIGVHLYGFPFDVEALESSRRERHRDCGGRSAGAGRI